MSKITIKIFIERAQKVHGDNFDYSNVTYIDSKTKVSIYCKNIINTLSNDQKIIGMVQGALSVDMKKPL